LVVHKDPVAAGRYSLAKEVLHDSSVVCCNLATKRVALSSYLRKMPLHNKDYVPKKTLLIVMRTVDFFKYSNQVTLMSAMDKRMLHTGSFHAGITQI